MDRITETHEAVVIIITMVTVYVAEEAIILMHGRRKATLI